MTSQIKPKRLVVVEISRAIAASYCTMILGDLGHDVIKIEPPGGDGSRRWPPVLADGHGTYFETVNRNKRSLVVDFGNPAGMQMLDRLLSRTDVLVCNFRRRAMEKYGLTPEVVAEKYPHITYASVSGSGINGPRANEGSTDLFAQAATGLISITGTGPGELAKIPIPIADLAAGMFAAIGILATNNGRHSVEKATHIEASLEDASLAMLLYYLTTYCSTKELPVPMGTAHASITPYQAYPTLDGQLALVVHSDDTFQRACATLGAPDLGEDIRFRDFVDRVANRSSLNETIRPILASRSTEYWLRAFADNDVPCSQVRTVADVAEYEEFRDRGIIVDVPRQGDENTTLTLAASPIVVDGVRLPIASTAPRLGMHSAQIASELGYAEDEIADLLRRSIIEQRHANEDVTLGSSSS